MKKWLKNIKKDQRGLTLVELLAVVVILAIVAAIAIVLIGNVIENSRKDAHVANAQQLIAAAKLYEANGGTIGEDGVTAETLISEGNLSPLTNPWTKEPYATGGNSAGKVEKDGNTYKATLVGGQDCTLNSVPEAELNKGRKACNYTSGG